ncbi:hypothetical protein BJY16_001541 [Actinoplanes octamycinicus]|uniref:Uncharacterized protein n=1 Tax=Actinoplanes octamycinicus TaxID=135948 RepID=A0A7W7GTS6_9ACTN|nr:hypothetical protein [Actinoplanes octamycinicus]MBB4738082.1 hypothetical protein [Actinoplanes octamycinicus]GIE59365.1 hypothetical protein Aoc01nite_47670 [Actinoplanes octamycinicus]
MGGALADLSDEVSEPSTSEVCVEVAAVRDATGEAVDAPEGEAVDAPEGEAVDAPEGEAVDAPEGEASDTAAPARSARRESVSCATTSTAATA